MPRLIVALLLALLGPPILSGCAVPPPAAVGIPGEGVALQRSDDGSAVAPEALEAVLARSGVIARLGPGARLSVFGIDLASGSGAAVYLGASSEFLFAAALAGRIEAQDGVADPGEVLVWDMLGAPPRRFGFDVDRFLATSSLAIQRPLRETLEEVAGGQARATYWGLVAPAQVNLQAPVPPSVEALRRDYLLQPEVIRLRRQAGGDPAALSRAVAERFVAAIAARDRAVVTALLHPVLFQQEGGQDWRVLRARFAEGLVSGGLPGALAGAQVSPAGNIVVAGPEGEAGSAETGAETDEDGEGIEIPAVWRVEGDAGAYRLEVGPYESMIYATALESQP